jgi:phosphoribosyl-AMP cyclohydrolase
MSEWLQAIKWNQDGLVPAIAQDYQTGRILMQAWVNAEALSLSASEGRAIYWSRSRARLWRKGEESGHIQRLHGIELDCDGDSLIFKVEQLGGIACHTGRHSCYFRRLVGDQWVESEPVIKDPEQIYS